MRRPSGIDCVEAPRSITRHHRVQDVNSVHAAQHMGDMVCSKTLATKAIRNGLLRCKTVIMHRAQSALIKECAKRIGACTRKRVVVEASESHSSAPYVVCVENKPAIPPPRNKETKEYRSYPNPVKMCF